MTIYEAYHISRTKLLQQNAKSVNELGSCAYRGIEGTMCSIGSLFPNNEYSPVFENKSITDVYHLIPSLRNLPQSFLVALQKVHDQHEPHEWEAAYDLLASQFGIPK